MRIVSFYFTILIFGHATSKSSIFGQAPIANDPVNKPDNLNAPVPDKIGAQIVEPACDATFLKTLIDFDVKPEFHEANVNSKLQTLCPQLPRTCCKFDQLNFLIKQFKSGKKNLNRIKVYSRTVTDILGQIGRDRFIQLAKNRLVPNENVSPAVREEVRQALEDINYTYDNTELAHSYLVITLNFYAKFFAGVACEVCRPGIHKFIQPAPLGGSTRMVISKKGAAEYFQAARILAQFTLYFKRLARLVSFLGCKSREPFKDILDSEERYAYHANLFEYCHKQIKEVKSFPENHVCMEAFGYFTSFNGLAYLDFLAREFYLVSVSLPELPKPACDPNFRFKRILSECLPRFYKLDQQKWRFGDLKLVFGDDDGWNLLENKYSEY